MNQLSQLLYLANVSGNVGTLLALFGVLVLIACVAFFIQSCIYYDDISRWSADRTAGLKKFSKSIHTSLKCLGLVLVLWVLAALCPSQDTVYAIAASELGGRALNSQTGGLAVQALNAWLKKQIAPPAAPTNQ